MGNIQEFLAAETYVPDTNLLVRRDEKGFSVMSTVCTYDLSPLSKVNGAQGEYYKSDFNPSTYDLRGKAISGPAKASLPYYKMSLDMGMYPDEHGKYHPSTTRDTLYVTIGEEVDSSWRLSIVQAVKGKAQ